MSSGGWREAQEAEMWASKEAQEGAGDGGGPAGSERAAEPSADAIMQQARDR
jgi:hypothetical protein